MPVTLPPPTPPRIAIKRRAPWRRSLVDLESGLRQGLRWDGSFYGHFFVASVLLASALVVGFPVIEWAILILAFTVVLSAQMFHQLLKTLWECEGRLLSRRTQDALRIGTAAVFVTIAGSLAVSGLLFARRIMLLWAE
jgi:diacylglycerol kinase